MSGQTFMKTRIEKALVRRRSSEVRRAAAFIYGMLYEWMNLISVFSIRGTFDMCPPSSTLENHIGREGRSMQ